MHFIFFVILTVLPLREALGMELVVDPEEINLENFEEIPFEGDRRSEGHFSHNARPKFLQEEEDFCDPHWRATLAGVSCCCGGVCWLPGGLLWGLSTNFLVLGKVLTAIGISVGVLPTSGIISEKAIKKCR